MKSVVSRVKTSLLPAHWFVASTLPLTTRRHYLHLLGTGRWGNFEQPKTFSEKVNWRITHDRRPLIAVTCDKLAMKQAARERVPDEDELRIPETIWFGTDLDEAPLDVDRPWILKPNHSSGLVLSSDKASPRALERSRSWVKSKMAHQLGEWGYQVARPVLLMEERIPFADGFPPDYKFFVFDGVPRVVQVNSRRFTSAEGLAFHGPDGHPLPVRDTRIERVVEPLPETWTRMVELAAKLADGWEFIRVDLYSVGNQIWFGEYTPYPGGGVSNFEPASFARWLGDWWHLPQEIK